MSRPCRGLRPAGALDVPAATAAGFKLRAPRSFRATVGKLALLIASAIGSTASAQVPITCGTSLTNYLGFGAVQEYLFNVGSDDAVAIEGLGISGTAVARMQVFGPNNYNAPVSGGNTCDGRIELRELQAGSYLLLVSDCFGSGSGTYALTLDSISAEFNGAPNCASDALTGAAHLNSGAVAAYKVTTAPGRLGVVANTSQTQTIGLEIRIYGPTGELLTGEAPCQRQASVQVDVSAGVHTVLIDTCDAKAIDYSFVILPPAGSGTPTPTRTASPTEVPEIPTATPSATATPIPPSPTASGTPSRTPSPSVTAAASSTPSAPPTATPTGTGTGSPTPSPTPTITPPWTATPTLVPTSTASPSPFATVTASPSGTTAPASSTATRSATPTATAASSASVTTTPTATTTAPPTTPLPSRTATASRTPSATPTATASATTTVTTLPTTPLPSRTATASRTPSATATTTASATTTVTTPPTTPLPSGTATASRTPTATATRTASAIPVTATVSASAKPSSSPTPTPSPTGTSPLTTATVTPSSTATASPLPHCVGDCSNDGVVTVDEILKMVTISLGTETLAGCTNGDANHDGAVTVDEILTAVNKSLNGCAATS